MFYTMFQIVIKVEIETPAEVDGPFSKIKNEIVNCGQKKERDKRQQENDCQNNMDTKNIRKPKRKE